MFVILGLECSAHLSSQEVKVIQGYTVRLNWSGIYRPCLTSKAKTTKKAKSASYSQAHVKMTRKVQEMR